MTEKDYKECVTNYADNVYRFILKNTRHKEDARDIVQTAFEKLWKGRHEVDAVKYYTVPFMLNFDFTPGRKDGFGLSVGASAGYKYSSRQKLRSDQTGKYKIHDDFDMEPWKISWIGELQLGPVKLYGSLATKSMFQKGLDQTPYTVGLRLSNW